MVQPSTCSISWNGLLCGSQIFQNGFSYLLFNTPYLIHKALSAPVPLLCSAEGDEVQ